MHKIAFFILFYLFSNFNLFSQEKLTWNTFADVSFTEVYSAAYGDIFLKPHFGTLITSYQGNRVSIKGYFLDFSSEDDQFYLLSKNPRSSCFFCGGAGPESVIEVVFAKTISFKTDQVVEVTGILELNVDDFDHCNYILREATGRLIK